MEKRNQSVIPFAILGMLTILFGFYTSTMNYANAISTVSVTFPAGSTELDVSYAGGIFSDNTDSEAFVIGANAGVAYVWKKSGSGLSENTIVANATLTGAGSARAIEINPATNLVYAVTNDKFWRLTSAPVVNLQRAEGIANSVMHLRYDSVNAQMYFCTNDVFGTINLVTLAPTTLFNNVGAGGLIDCQVDGADGFMYLSGTSTGLAGTDELAKVSLDTFTIVDAVSLPTADFLYGHCIDVVGNIIWAMESSNARVRSYDMATLTLQNTITVGTTPRYCSISDGEQARRLYVTNEGTDNVSILDIDANVVLTTVSTCNQGVTAPRPDTKRLFNTTDTFVPCPEVTSTVIIDNTVSEEQPEVDPDSCDNPANAMLLRCRLGENDGLGGIGQSVGSGVLLLGCNIIFVDCTDENPQTNGLGLLAFIASIFVIVGLFYYAIGKDAFHLPLFIWVVIIVALSAFFTLTGIIDPVFLIVSIIAIVALAVPKVISIIQGSTFGRGSTA